MRRKECDNRYKRQPDFAAEKVCPGGGGLCGEVWAHPGRRTGFLLLLRDIPPHQRGCVRPALHERRLSGRRVDDRVSGERQSLNQHLVPPFS